MLHWPVAAARLEAPTTGPGLRSRFEGLIERAGEGSALLERLSPADNPRFSWREIAGHLARELGLTEGSEGRAVARDLDWLQYCIYAVFRVQDDLVDGETRDAGLAVQTNHLLAEAARCAARHFDGSSPFWQVFQHGIDETSSAIVALERLQRSPERDPNDELALYAELSSSLKIAAAGTCFASDQDDLWFEQLSPTLDAFATAAQVVDDLHDVREDLDRGCINHAAWFLSRPVFGDTPEATEAVVASNLATTDRVERLLASVSSPLGAALAGLDADLCPRVHRTLHEYRRGLDELGAQIRERALGLFERTYSSSETSGSTQKR